MPGTWLSEYLVLSLHIQAQPLVPSAAAPKAQEWAIRAPGLGQDVRKIRHSCDKLWKLEMCLPQYHSLNRNKCPVEPGQKPTASIQRLSLLQPVPHFIHCSFLIRHPTGFIRAAKACPAAPAEERGRLGAAPAPARPCGWVWAETWARGWPLFTSLF